MKNVFKFSFIFALFFMTISCTQNINSSFSKGNESLEFSFRANEALVGTKLIVTVEENGNVLDTKSKDISKDNDVVKILFNNLNIGSEVIVKAVLKKDKTVLYEGSDAVFIGNKDNKVSLKLISTGVELKIDPGQLNIIPELEGALFKVSVNGKNYPPVQIKSGSPIIVDIGNYPIESEINISATIEKEGKAIYEVNNLKHVVTDSDNIIGIALNQVRYNFSLSPSIHVGLTDFENATISATVISKTEDPIQFKAPYNTEKSEFIVPIGFFAPDEIIDIDVVIASNVRVFYEGTIKNYKLSKDSLVITEPVTPFGGYFLWSNAEGMDSGPRYNINYNNLTGEEVLSIQNPADVRNNKVIDFSFDNDGTVWVVGGYNGDLLNIHKFCEKDPISYENIETATNSAISSVNAIAATNNGAYVTSSFSGANKVHFIQEKGASSLNVQEFSIDGIHEITNTYKLTEMAVSGINMMLVYESTDNPQRSFKIYRSILDTEKHTICVDSIPLMDSSTYSEFSNGSYRVTDLQIIGTFLYALVIDMAKGGVEIETGYYGNNSRGALVEIDITNGNATVIGLMNKAISKEQANGGPDNGLMIIQEGDNATYNTCFMGPRKFIAIKPKKLVIADSGAVWDTLAEGNKKLKQRVVTVNLEDKAMTGMDFAMGDFFDGSLSNGSQYSNYTYYHVGM